MKGDHGLPVELSLCVVCFWGGAKRLTLLGVASRFVAPALWLLTQPRRAGRKVVSF
jgi:hypothetical protein